jgi:XTP/dITP diphosphohydrolase
MADSTLILATKNKGKVREISNLFSGFDIQIKSLDDFGPIPTVIEDGETFDDNAYKKAHLTARMLGFPAMADDSGLVVEALGGAPGVHSARFAGDNATDEENNRKLLKEMEGKDNRNAFFESVISLAVPWGPALTYVGRCEGKIALEPKGQNGFGYDPLFYYPPLDKTFAQMENEEKNRVSHRGKAINEFLREIDKVLKWIEMMIKKI